MTRCLIAVDAPHNGDPDLVAWPPSFAELVAAARTWHDPAAIVDLYRIAGSDQRCDALRALSRILIELAPVLENLGKDGAS